MTTLIECKLHREGGSHVELGGIDYHFKPNEFGHHVADVADDDHADRLLSITEAYRLYRPNKAAKAVQPVTSDEVQMLNGSKVHPEKITMGTLSLGIDNVINEAFVESGLTPDEWNTLTDEVRHNKIDDVLDKIADRVEAAKDEPEVVATVDVVPTIVEATPAVTLTRPKRPTRPAADKKA